MGHYDRNLEILSKNVDAFDDSKYCFFQIYNYSIQFFDNLNDMKAQYKE